MGIARSTYYDPPGAAYRPQADGLPPRSGRETQPAAQRGVMIVSSGNVVHNLRRIEWNRPDAGTNWAQRFDDMVGHQMTEAPADILKAVEHPDYNLAVPTPDYFIPLLYTAGLAAEEQDAKALLRGYAMGSLSMICYGVGMDDVEREKGQGAAALPEGVPPDQPISESNGTAVETPRCRLRTQSRP